MTNTQLTYTEYRERKLNFTSTFPSYLQSDSETFERMAKHSYENYYLKGRISVYAE